MRAFLSLGILVIGASISQGQEPAFQFSPGPMSFIHSEPKVSRKQWKKQTTSLEKMVNSLRVSPEKTQKLLPLERDWIGAVKEQSGGITQVRLEMGQIKHGKIYLMSIAAGAQPEASESPEVVALIPDEPEIKSCKTVKQLDQHFGSGHQGFASWVGPNGIHGTKYWVCVSPNLDGGLDYVRVVAEFFQSEEVDKENAEISSIEVSRGSLRQSNPNSEIEKMIYSSRKDSVFSYGG